MTDARMQTGVNVSNIKQACTHEYAQVNGFIWLFEEDYCSGNYDKEYILGLVNKEFEHPNSRPVIQCDLNMNFIARYKNISEASRQSGVLRSGINDNCIGRLKTSGDFVWLYEEDYEKYKTNKDEVVFNIKNTNHKKCPVFQFDLEGNLVTRFSSVLEASKTTGVDRKSIVYVCEGKYKQAGGYIWRRTLDTLEDVRSGHKKHIV